MCNVHHNVLYFTFPTTSLPLPNVPLLQAYNKTLSSALRGWGKGKSIPLLAGVPPTWEEIGEFTLFAIWSICIMKYYISLFSFCHFAIFKYTSAAGLYQGLYQNSIPLPAGVPPTWEEIGDGREIKTRPSSPTNNFLNDMIFPGGTEHFIHENQMEMERKRHKNKTIRG